MIKILNYNNNYYLNVNILNKLQINIKMLLFKKKDIFLIYLNLLNIYFLNKNYKNKKKITDSLTFNYWKKSFIFVNLYIIKIKHLKVNFFLIYNFYIIHCILHSQNFKENSKKNIILLNKIQHSLLKSMGFYLNYRL